MPAHRIPIAQRFWSKVTITGDLFSCWEWQGKLRSNGYGVLSAGAPYAYEYAAHRIAYILQNGSIPAQALVLHSCDNKRCVRGTHLRLGTHSENIQEAYDRGLRCSAVHGHPHGESHPNAKITDKQVEEILCLLQERQLSQSAIALLFHIHPSVISRIKHKKRRWNFVQT